jgi:hypothetical protein
LKLNSHHEVALSIIIKCGLSEGPIRKANYNFDPGALELFLFLLWSCFVLLDLGMKTSSKNPNPGILLICNLHLYMFMRMYMHDILYLEAVQIAN